MFQQKARPDFVRLGSPAVDFYVNVCRLYGDCFLFFNHRCSIPTFRAFILLHSIVFRNCGQRVRELNSGHTQYVVTDILFNIAFTTVHYFEGQYESREACGQVCILVVLGVVLDSITGHIFTLSAMTLVVRQTAKRVPGMYQAQKKDRKYLRKCFTHSAIQK